jgi:hypothetical protein
MFGSKVAVAEKPVTGVDVLRTTVAARVKAPGNLSVLARNVGCGPQDLEAFATGRELALPILNNLARELFSARLGGDGMLAKESPAATSIGVPRERFDPDKVPEHQKHLVYHHKPFTLADVSPRDLTPKPARPAGPVTRPGWSGTHFC